MKYIAIAALLGAASAFKLNDSEDCPNSKQVFSYDEKAPSAAGFVQVSICQQADVQGVSCVPNAELFATGMEGTEDLGEDITMKGEKYHYAQKGFASGMEGTEDLGETITMKGNKYSYAQKKFAEGMEGTEDLGEDITMKGNKFHYAQKGFASGMEGTEDLGETITMKGNKYSYAQKKFAEGM